MKNNKGFSLIELIVVICIMAIAVGLMAPQLIRYLEKTNVSADIQLADTIRTGVTTAIVDAEVQADTASHPYLDLMASDAGMNINENTSFLNSDCVLKESLEESFGFPINQIMMQMRSARGSDCDCNVRTINNMVLVTFTCTDNTGLKDTSNSTPENDIFVDQILIIYYNSI